MPITVEQPSSITGEQAAFSWLHTCQGNFLLVNIDMIPDSEQVVSAVTYNDIALTPYKQTQSRDKIRSEVWILVNPPQGTFPVAVAFSDTAKACCNAASFGGIDPNTPIYYDIDGAGDQVKEIPLSCKLRNGDLMLGCGAASGTGTVGLQPGQVELWNELNDGHLRSQGIYTIPPFDMDMTLVNTISEPCVWAVALLGLKAAA